MKKIFVVAPANNATGGPELLHQFARKLKNKNIPVSMFYIDGKVNVNPVHENYEEYDIDYVISLEDDENNIIIIPETKIEIFKNYQRSVIIPWWLSVDFYFHYMSGVRGYINRLLLHVLNIQKYLFFNANKYRYHLVQSNYANDFLVSKNIDWSTIISLSDYLYNDFLKIEYDPKIKEDLVVYNPKKGIKFVKRLKQYCPEYKFIPIINMNRHEVIDLLKRAKVYIDFGFHPGKDRIPREAAFLGCCVLTNTMGSCLNNIDVNIPSEYKFEGENFEEIRLKIKECFENYQFHVTAFDEYRAEIKDQESKFNSEVNCFLKSVYEKV